MFSRDRLNYTPLPLPDRSDMTDAEMATAAESFYDVMRKRRDGAHGDHRCYHDQDAQPTRVGRTAEYCHSHGDFSDRDRGHVAIPNYREKRQRDSRSVGSTAGQTW